MGDLNREHAILEKIMAVVDFENNKEENLRVFIALAAGCLVTMGYSSYEMEKGDGSYIKLEAGNNNGN